MPQSKVKRLAIFHARLSHSKQLLESTHSVTLASFCSLTKNIYHDHIEKHRMRMTHYTRIRQPRRKMSWQNAWAPFSHWWHQSASHKHRNINHRYGVILQGLWSQVVDITTAWYLPIPASRLVKSINLTWYCYSSSCPPYVRSQASSSFSRTVPRHTGRLRHQLRPITLPNVELFQEFSQNRLVSKFAMNQWSKPTTSTSHDVLLIIIHISGCFCFFLTLIFQNVLLLEIYC